MLAQFAIFEFRMYFVPGAYLVFLLNIILHFSFNLTVTESFGITGNFGESLVFVLLAYIFGHVLQTLAHGFKFKKFIWSSDQIFKKKYWRGHWASELLLYKSEKFIEEPTRQKILTALIDKNIISNDESKIFDQDISKDGCHLSQSVFYILLGKFEDDQTSGVKTSESNFYMLRGFYFSSQFCFVISLILCLLFLLNFREITQKVVILGLLAIVFFLLWQLFQYRCRGAAQGFVKKTFASVLTH